MNDFVDSIILLSIDHFGKIWYEHLKCEMELLEDLSKSLKKSITNFFKHQKSKVGEKANKACNVFWQLCELSFEKLLIACKSPEDVMSIRPIFLGYVNKVYDMFCPKDTARQLDVWAKNRPNLKKYLSK